MEEGLVGRQPVEVIRKDGLFFKVHLGDGEANVDSNRIPFTLSYTSVGMLVKFEPIKEYFLVPFDSIVDAVIDALKEERKNENVS